MAKFKLTPSQWANLYCSAHGNDRPCDFCDVQLCTRPEHDRVGSYLCGMLGFGPCNGWPRNEPLPRTQDEARKRMAPIGKVTNVREDEQGVKWDQTMGEPDKRPEQVGGTHYRDLAPHEVFDVVDKWQEAWPIHIQYYLGNALKYISRLGRKSKGRAAISQDIDKAIHYLQEARKRL